MSLVVVIWEWDKCSYYENPKARHEKLTVITIGGARW
jgi:hypothetical protein